MATSSFAGCYLLRSQNPSFKEACYVGFTVDPPHRLKQHNGIIQGGAFKTHTKRPWEMTIVVYGFPTRKHALRFEWTWQHPTEAKRLKNIDWSSIFQQSGGPTKYKSHIRILKEMLNMSPWDRLDLRVCVTVEDVFKMLTEIEPKINSHHTVKMGDLEDLPIQGKHIPTPTRKVPSKCVICVSEEKLPEDPVNWVICPFCGTFLHLRCLAKHLISQSPHAGTALIPTRGVCPACCESLLWRDIVELRNQFYDDNTNDSLLQVAIHDH